MERRNLPRIALYYAILAFFLGILLKPLLLSVTAWQGAWIFLRHNISLCTLFLEAGLIFLQDRSFARSSLVRLSRCSPSHEADLFYWSLYSFLSLVLMGSSARGNAFPLYDFGGLPSPWGAVGFIFVFSFSQFVIHLLCHRIPALWELHKVHHSATELDFATSQREHLLLWLLSFSVSLVFRGPMDGMITLFLMFFAVLGYLQHSSLDYRLGWLGYVIVSPHAHRLHHLRQPEFHNRNFGSHLALWDQLFGTFVYQTTLPPEEMERSFGLVPGEAGIPLAPLPGLFVSTRRSVASILGRAF